MEEYMPDDKPVDETDETGVEGGQSSKGDKPLSPKAKKRKKRINTGLRKVNDARQIDAKAKEPKVIELRGNGLTFAQIGANIGLTQTGAMRLYYRALGRAAKGSKAQLERADEQLDERFRVISELHASVSRRLREAVKAGASVQDIGTLATAVGTLDRQLTQIAERKARLLGQDAPTRSVVSGKVDVDVTHVDATRQAVLAQLEAIAKAQLDQARTVESPALPEAGEPEKGED